MASLAQNLYTKKTRFVYELVQNAEDNEYSLLKGSDKPSLTFHLFKDRIVVDSNEDGFAANNVIAICRINASTKSKTFGYVGEKGIGFKSVFTVSRKVHVQSGIFSFAFDYDHNSPTGGLGMITPLNQDHEDLPEGVRTRLTMTLDQENDRCGLAAIYQEFENLPDTLLLFLRKLKFLKVRIEQADSSIVENSYSITAEEGKAKIHCHTATATTTLNFFIARSIAQNMPEEEARAGKEGSTRITEAEVVLGFPLDDDGSPMLQQESQYAFAFLPLKRAGFKVYPTKP
jgi:hypothetical protein